MRLALIFQPMGALALLTFAVAVLVAVRRFAASTRGDVRTADFRYGESERVPARVAIANRNYMNLLELPVLFYVVCLMFFAIGRVDRLILGLAWAYVGLRLLHSLVHLSYNNVAHRLACFAASNGVLLALWAVFFGGDA